VTSFFHSDFAFSMQVNFMQCSPQQNCSKKMQAIFTSDLDSSPEIHGQVEDVVRGDNFAGGPVHDVAVLVEQGDHVGAPAHIKHQRKIIWLGVKNKNKNRTPPL
jgi:hypothetical protein